MKETVQESYFIDRFAHMDRKENFSYEGKKALFAYLEEYEHSTGEELELDVIALCCEYTEYSSLEEFHKEYNKEEYPDLESIRDHTQFIEIEGTEGFIIQCF